MAFNPTSPITGAPQTGFTSPTFTFVDDVAPGINGKQKAITAIGGTPPAGITLHSVSSPFTQTFTRPSSVKVARSANPLTGVVQSSGKNTYKLLTRKGVVPGVNQSPQVFPIETSFSVPVGADSYDIANIRAAVSAHIGLLQQVSAGLGDTLNTAVI